MTAKEVRSLGYRKLQALQIRWRWSIGSGETLHVRIAAVTKCRDETDKRILVLAADDGVRHVIEQVSRIERGVEPVKTDMARGIDRTRPRCEACSDA